MPSALSTNNVSMPAGVHALNVQSFQKILLDEDSCTDEFGLHKTFNTWYTESTLTDEFSFHPI